MSVTNIYIAIDWSRLDAASHDEDLAGYLLDALDAAEDWLCRVPFGDDIDPYYFESWDGLTEFHDWFREVRGAMDSAIVAEFAAVFMAVGLLHRDDTAAPDPIKVGVDFSSDWLLAAIPPDLVARLASRAEALDLDRISQEFQRAADQLASEMVPDGATMANWLLALRAGLRETADAGRGMIMGAA